jgi:hypothetical protein
MDRRRQRVAEQGPERSEYTDVGEQIAKAKGCSKVRGTDLVKCPLCDGYYPEGKKDEHRHVYYPGKPRQRRFTKITQTSRNKANTLRAPFSMVIRDERGDIIKRVRL